MAVPASDGSFSYQPLDTSRKAFRLVNILPGDEDDIHCQISNSSLETQSGQYVGVSYTWGFAASDKFILLNGYRFLVRDNLHVLLRCFRKQRITVPLWIDAMCINQASVTERNHQVTIMADIYGEAGCIYAWLGQHADDSDWLLETLQDVKYLRDDNTWFRGQSFRFLQALQRFAERTYWSRIWIVQELVLAKEVVLMCGNSTLLWRRIEDFFKRFLPHKIEAAWQFSPQLTTLGQVLATRNCSNTLWQLFDRFGDKDCSIPHDKIYALLGMAEDYYTPKRTYELSIDYNSTIFDLFYQVVTNESFRGHEKTLFDFGRKFVKVISLEYRACLSSRYANARMKILLKRQGIVGVVDQEVLDAPQLASRGYSLFQQQRGKTNEWHICAKVSNATACQEGDSYFSLTSENLPLQLVVRWTCSTSSTNNAVHNTAGRIIGSSMVVWSDTLSHVIATVEHSETGNLKRPWPFGFLPEFAADVKLRQEPGNVALLDISFYTFILICERMVWG